MDGARAGRTARRTRGSHRGRCSERAGSARLASPPAAPPKVLPDEDLLHWVDTLRESRVESGDQLHFRGNPRQMVKQHRNRRLAAVAVRADGRRVPVHLPVAEVSILARLERVVLGLLGILTGSRRETGGKRG